MSLKNWQDHDIDDDLDVIFEEFRIHDKIGMLRWMETFVEI
jgi:hypothetical protein